jgi:pimeloyl-ACP methyl ester carboxylesterase
MAESAMTSQRLDEVERRDVPHLTAYERRVAAPVATSVLVHGALDRGRSFTRLSRRLARFDVVAYDRRGYQGSPDARPLSLDGHVEDLVAIAETEMSRAPVVAFGHSFGGVVVLAAASRRPELFRAVVVYETPLPWMSSRPDPPRVLDRDPANEVERFFRRAVSNEAWERLSDSERRSRLLDGEGLVTDLRAVQEPCPFAVERITSPLVAAFGESEFGRRSSEAAIRLAEQAPSGRIELVVGAGHGAHLSHPDSLARVIEGSLD